MAYTLNSSLPSLNLCLSSNGKYRGALEIATPSFDLSQSIKVPLDSIGLISLSKLYMSSPPMLDNNMFMTVQFHVEEYDPRLKEWYPETYDLRVNADTSPQNLMRMSMCFVLLECVGLLSRMCIAGSLSVCSERSIPINLWKT